MKVITTELKLLGQKIVLKTPGNQDPHKVNRVLQLATSRVLEAEKRSQGAAAYQIIFLALLDLAEEYLMLHQNINDFQPVHLEKKNQILNLIEAER